MAFENPGQGALDYFPCRYGHSKLLFRGPRRKLDGAYCAVLGGSETYGKYVREPYPALIEAVAKIGDKFRALDLTEASTRAAVAAATSIKALYEGEAGTDYLG